MIDKNEKYGDFDRYARFKDFTKAPHDGSKHSLNAHFLDTQHMHALVPLAFSFTPVWLKMNCSQEEQQLLGSRAILARPRAKILAWQNKRSPLPKALANPQRADQSEHAL